MRKIEKILLPVDFPNTSLSVIHQAAVLARHFNSEIVMLHVVTAESRRAGVPEYGSELADWDMLAVITQEAENDLDQSLGQELKHLAIRCVLCEGNPAQAILHTAQVEKADLIMMASHGAALNQFLVGSVTTKVLQGSGCPVWTDGRVEKSEASLAADNPMLLYGGAGMWMHGMRTVKHGEQRGPIPEFAIHNVLCAVDLGPRSNKAASWAAAMAAEFGAHLTLAHVTASVELWGPGGNYADPKLREELVDDASRRLAKLQQETGVKADTLIGSGDVPRVLSQAAKQTKADLLVTGCYPYDGNLRIHGYPIIWAVPIPVLSV